VYCAMRAIGCEDWCTDVSTDVCSAECACSACACLALQRGRRAIPAIVPVAHNIRSSLDCVAESECSEVVSG
jgi:hypothetical protein